MKYFLVFLADWGNGLFAISLASLAYGVKPEWWFFVVGMLLSHLPDLDAVPELLRRGKVATSSENPKDHRDGLHYPIILIALGLLFWWLMGFWGLVILLGFVLHLFNDFYGTGWGIKLFWPVSNKQYKLLGRRVNRLKRSLIRDSDWQGLPSYERRLKFIISWSQEELIEYMQKWGMEDWIEDVYLSRNWIVITETLLFLIAIVLAASLLL